jgi:hypothetical protein
VQNYFFLETGAKIDSWILGRSPETPAFKRFQEQQYTKLASIDENFFKTKAFKTEDWKGPQYDKRHTRFAVHGFHHLICTTKDYHAALDSCVCNLCKGSCTQYHLEECIN